MSGLRLERDSSYMNPSLEICEGKWHPARRHGLRVGVILSVAPTECVHSLCVGIYLLLLQLSDGLLRFLQALAGCVVLLPHHRQLPLDYVVLLRFLCPRHLTLEQQARRGGGGGQDQLRSCNLETQTIQYTSVGGKGLFWASRERFHAKGAAWCIAYTVLKE